MGMFNFKRKKKENDEAKILENSTELLAIKLFFKSKPVFNDEIVKKELNKKFKNIEFPENSEGLTNSRHYLFKDYEVKFEEGSLPAQATVFIPDTNTIDYSELEASFGQSWSWSEAEEIVRKCSHEVLITDLMSRTLDYKERLECFQKFTSSIISAMHPVAVWICNSEMIVKPSDFVKKSAQNHYKNVNVFMNVRLFTIEATHNEMIMDTLGLNALGLPDFEFRFTHHDPQDIAGLLFNYGSYVFENGLVIEHGNTIQGIKEDQKWKCFFKDSQLEPKRVVIGIEDGL